MADIDVHWQPPQQSDNKLFSLTINLSVLEF